MQVVMGVGTHAAAQVPGFLRTRGAQASTELEQLDGQAPGPDEIPVSQASPVATVPSPQPAQSASLVDVHSAGQQPSPPTHEVTGVDTHAASHVPAALRTDGAQASSELGQLDGQAPGPEEMDVSQASVVATVPSPHPVQSESSSGPHPGEQRPSPLAQLGPASRYSTATGASEQLKEATSTATATVHGTARLEVVWFKGPPGVG
jgi:hypothetical protein